MPRIGPPAAARARSAPSRPAARSRARSSSVAFVPGTTTRSARSTSAGERVKRTRTPGSAPSASTSVKLLIQRSRSTATSSVSPPAGGGVSGARASSASESSPSIQRSSTNGSTPSTGRPVRAVQVLQPRREDRRVAAELVDHEARHERLVGGLEQRQRAEQRGEHAAAVDVADHEHRQAGGAREAHVRDVAGAQVDLRRRARALADDDVVAGAQVGQRARDDRPQLLLQRLVGARVGVGVGRAHDDDLAVALARRLDQDRVHRRLGLDSARPPPASPGRGRSPPRRPSRPSSAPCSAP